MNENKGIMPTKIELTLEHHNKVLVMTSSARNQDSRPRNQESSRKTVNVEETASKAMIAIDGAGFDWSDMKDDTVPINMAIMDFSDSEVQNNKTCSKTCLKSFETLKKQYDDLRVEFNKTEFDLANYKRGLFAPLRIDLSYSGLEEFQEPEFEAYGPKASKSVCVDTSNEIKKNPQALIIEDWVSDCDEEEFEVEVLNLINLNKLVHLGNGCYRHMTRNKPYLTDYQDYDGGFVAFAGSSKGGKITGKGKIRTGKLDFEDVYFVKELKFNLFSVSQMCDRKNNVLFNKTECLVLSLDFKLPDESQVLLKVPRKNNMYSFDIKNIVPLKDLTCLIVKATNDESNLWHRRLGHINFKTLNKLVKGNLVRGLPSKIFENNYTCVACQKGKQHKASCKSKLVNSVSQPLQILHMDLFGPTVIKSIMGKMYCLVVTDDYSRFSWVFFLAKKDETSSILKDFITGIENQLNHKVKIIRCDNGTEFENYEMNHFCGIKGIKREFSNARTPQKNRLGERKNKTLIEAARTMLADSLLPIPFWAEAVNIACYVQNKVLVTKPYNKTPYELLIGRTPTISFMRPFGCPLTILNTLDQLGKFDGKADEGFLVGYSINSKSFRVYNSRTRKVEENLHVNFLENKPNVEGSGSEINSNAGQDGKKKVSDQEYILLPLLNTSSYVPLSSEFLPKNDGGKKQNGSSQEGQCNNQERPYAESNTQTFNTVGPSINTANINDNTGNLNCNTASPLVNTATPTYADNPNDPLACV
uniref:Putative ribonuclease H-like domain-containing protein n=1 Tax=Tanacetum cinerariifolium TaxID=118510 RepID=A0A699GND8_TANCI|nr:putative ribonuclease H-like domain-containing protein [Tanacetum cinerariifolium]